MRRYDPGLPALWAEAEHLFADNRPQLSPIPGMAGCFAARKPLFGWFVDLAEDLRTVGDDTLREQSGWKRFLVAARSRPVGRCSAEVGAGANGTTSTLLPVLPPDRSQYWFTDVSDFFFDRARERFAGEATMTFCRLDLDHDLRTQGYAPGSIDVVVAANSVHASVDVPAALRRLRDLAPGGVLI